MQSRFARLLCFSLLALLAAGCTKTHTINTESTYKFTNQTGRRVTFDLYPSKADYGNNTNRLQQLIFEPGSSHQLKLKVGESYWVDWYSDGYTFNNWDMSSTNLSFKPELKIADVDDSRTLNATYQDTTRSIMLNGGELSTSWRGVVTGGTNQDGTHVFTFKKDFTGIHTFTNTSGQTLTEQFTYRLYTISRDQFTTYYFSFFIDRNGLNIYRATCNLKNVTPITGRDQLYITPVNTGGGTSTNFFVTRQ